MIPLKEKIVEKLKNFSEIELQELLNFADFLLWQRRQQEVAWPPDETGNSQPANMDEECEVICDKLRKSANCQGGKPKKVK